jgi:glycosyltransferase involved in cell wall biosynthesis
MRSVAITFTNFGPYHLARLRALAAALSKSDTTLVAYETASAEGSYYWETDRRSEPFKWKTLFPGRTLESVPRAECVSAMREALDRDRPDACYVVGYYRPECMAMLHWCRARRRPTVLMSESQAIDHPRVWWKEAVKRQRVRRFSSALVGGPRHRDYLVSLGMDADRISLGYNAVDGESFAAEAAAWRAGAAGRAGLPSAPYFLAVSRFVPEKNLPALVRAYDRYRREAGETKPWDLVLCGDGPGSREVWEAVAASPFAGSIHRPGFLQERELARWYAYAGAFVHPSLMEPWGLVVNEAAACGLPLLVSERAGSAETFVPEGPSTSGRRFDPRDEQAIAAALAWVAGLDPTERRGLGERAAGLAREWGLARFARGATEALQVAVAFEALRDRRPAAATA